MSLVRLKLSVYPSSVVSLFSPMRNCLLCWILDLLLSWFFFLNSFFKPHLYASLNILLSFLLSCNWKHTIHIFCVLLISFHAMLTSVAVTPSLLLQNSFPSFGFSKFTYPFPCWWVFEVLTCFRLLRIVCVNILVLISLHTLPCQAFSRQEEGGKGRERICILSSWDIPFVLVSSCPKRSEVATPTFKGYWEM